MIRRLSLVALAVFAAHSATATAATPGCTLAPTNGTENRTLGDRPYAINVPEGLTAKAVPLLVSLHGAGSTAAEDENGTGWTPFAAAHGFIVVYPGAHTWSDQTGLPDFGRDVWDPYTQSSRDIAFLRRLVADVSAHYCIDARRMFSDGWSNGAVMSERVACDAADLFAAVNSYAGGDPTVWTQSGIPADKYSGAPCRPSRPIAVSMLAGDQDFTYGGLATNASTWRGLDDCAADAVHTTDGYGATDTWSCAAGTAVVARVVKGVSHLWPSGDQGEDQRRRIWSFYLAHPLPCPASVPVCD